MRKYFIKSLIIGLTFLGWTACLPQGAVAAQIDVYLEGAYNDNYLDVYLYADLNVSNVISYGVRVGFDSSELQVLHATKNVSPTPYTSNETLWQLGNGDNRNKPDPVILPNAVVFKGGILDEDEPSAGVPDPVRVFLGTIRFETALGATMPPDPALTLTYAEEYSADPDSYKNFVRYEAGLQAKGEVIDSADDSGVDFSKIRIYERGDANSNGTITRADRKVIRYFRKTRGAVYPWMDCNADGNVTRADRRCIRYLLAN